MKNNVATQNFMSQRIPNEYWVSQSKSVGCLMFLNVLNV